MTHRTRLGIVVGLLAGAFAVGVLAPGQASAASCPTTNPTQTGTFAGMSETGSIVGNKVIGPVTFTVTVTPQWATGPQPNINTSPSRGRAPAVFVSNNNAAETRGPTNHLVIETSQPVTNLALTVAFFGTTATERMRNFTTAPTVSGQGTFTTAGVVVPTSPDGTVVLTWAAEMQRVEFDWTSPGGGASYIGTVVTYTTAVCDMGDAPESYGSAHSVGATTALVLGQGFTADLTDKYSANATADTDDALGLPLPPVVGGTYALTVPLRDNTSNPATLQGWIDLDRSGTFDASEGTSVTVGAGATTGTLSWTVGADVGGPSFVRLRLHQDQSGPVGPTGPSAGGEVEDYALTITSDPGISLTKTVVPAEVNAAGDLVTYSFDVVNIGNVPLTDITIDEAAFSGTGTAPAVTCPPEATSLLPGVAVTCTATYDVTQSDIDVGMVSNTATASGTSPVGVDSPVSEPSSADVTIDRQPGISLVKSADPSDAASFVAGQDLLYTFVVTNTGNVTLTNVAVTETDFTGTGPPPVITCPPGALLPGGQVVCRAPYTITQADVNAGSISNGATASGMPPDSLAPPVASDSVDVPSDRRPAIALTKTVAPAVVSAAGDAVTYSFNVVNTGNVTLTDITVDETAFSGAGTAPSVACPPAAALLLPGAAVTCSATYAVMQEDIDVGTVTNTATASATAPGGVDNPVSEPSSASLTVDRRPGISVLKSADPSEVSAAGDVVSYSLLVTNTGNVTLTDVTATDSAFTGSGVAPTVVCPPEAATLVPGDDITCSANYEVTQADIDAGQIENTATATATAPTGLQAPAAEPSVAIVETNPGAALTIAKATTTSAYTAVGDVIDYTFTVTNAGNVTVSAIAVVDPGLDAPATCDVTTLTPGISTECAGSHTVGQGDLDAGGFTNTALATGTSPAGTAVDSPTATVTVPAETAPSLTLDKASIAAQFQSVGETVDYTFTVTNTGNVTLTGIVISDPLLSAPATCSVTTLTPGHSTACAGDHTVTAGEVAAGALVNTATALGRPFGSATVISSPPATVTLLYVPSIQPIANDDIAVASFGQPVTIDLLANDSLAGSAFVPASVRLIDSNGDPVTNLDVPGEGTYAVNPDGTVTFTPVANFSGLTTPIEYRVLDASGTEVRASITIQVQPDCVTNSAAVQLTSTSITTTTEAGPPSTEPAPTTSSTSTTTSTSSTTTTTTTTTTTPTATESTTTSSTTTPTTEVTTSTAQMNTQAAPTSVETTPVASAVAPLGWSSPRAAPPTSTTPTTTTLPLCPPPPPATSAPTTAPPTSPTTGTTTLPPVATTSLPSGVGGSGGTGGPAGGAQLPATGAPGPGGQLTVATLLLLAGATVLIGIRRRTPR